MKTALTFCIIVFSIFENANISTSNNVELSPGELIIRNYSNYYMKYSVYPIGALFNSDYEYSPKCVSESPEYTYLIGGEKSDIPIGAYYTLDEDNVGGDGADDAIGRGNYRIDFYEKINTEYQLKNYCYVDFGDHDYPYQNVNFVADILIDYYSDSDIRVWGLFQLPEDRTIRIWDQRARNISAYKLPNKNGFISSSEYLQYPINAIQYGGINHLNPGDLGMNLVINHNITTRDAALGNGEILIFRHCWCSKKFAEAL